MTYLTNDAVALRPFRVDVKRNEFVNYEAVEFLNGAAGCDMYLRRLAAFGQFLGEDVFSEFAVDVFDQNGDILHTFGVTQKGFAYLRRQLRLRRDHA